MPCIPNSASESYADFITRYYTSPEEFLSQVGTDCIDFINYQFAVVHLPLDSVQNLNISTAAYTAIPKLYTLLDMTSMDASGILNARELPPLSGDGRGVMIGFIDTGIDYRNPLFLDIDGTSRILGIWDQTLEEESPISSNFFRPLYGAQYTKSQIDTALLSDTPLSIVPSVDTNGHGTAIASIAAGGIDESAGFSGAAPQCYIGVVKLKPAKQYLRNFFQIIENADAYQENDIMMGITYLFSLARQYNTPLVICLGIGTNMGSHTGTSNLGLLLNEMSAYNGTAFVIAAGNETGFAHHFRAETTSNDPTVFVELKVGENTSGFSMELWSQEIAVYTIDFLSPSGQQIRGVPARSKEAQTFHFLLENTEITVYSRITSNPSGSQLIFLRFQNPLPGIWTLIVTNVTDLTDAFHIWLPSHGLISDDTFFLRPDPDTTITGPGNSRYPITVGAYNHNTGGIYIHSSRGYSRSEQIKPDLAAAGVEILSAGIRSSAGTSSLSSTLTYRRLTGTSAAAAHVAGAAAILLRWGILEGNDPFMNSSTIKTYLIRGAGRNPILPYPNREFGYGTLNLYQAFLNLRI